MGLYHRLFGRSSSVQPISQTQLVVDTVREDAVDAVELLTSRGFVLKRRHSVPTSRFSKFLDSLHKPIERNSRLLRYWAHVYDVVCVYILMIVPFTMAFPYETHTAAWLALDYIANACLLIDMVVIMRTVIRDDYGVQKTDLKDIFAEYRRTWFWPDLLCSIPFDLIPLFLGEYMWWAILRLPRLLRIRPLIKHFLDLRIPGLSKPISRLMKNLIVLLLLSHYDACFFWFVSEHLVDEETSFVNMPMHPKEPGRARDEKLLSKYIYSAHWAMRMIVYNFREMKSEREKLYEVFEFIVGVLLYGSVFGSIASLIRAIDTSSALNEAGEEHNFRMEIIKDYMREKNFPIPLQKKIRDSYEVRWQLNQGMDEANLFLDLPPMLQQSVANFLYMNLVQSVALFKDTDSGFRNALAMSLKPLTVLKSWYIFRQGEEGQEMYFVRKGEVDVMSGDETKTFCTLKEGAFFGEIALFEKGRRTATCKAKTDCNLCVLTRDDFNVIMEKYPSVAEKITLSVAERKERDRKRKEEEEEKKKKDAEDEEQRKKEEAERLEKEEARLAQEEEQRAAEEKEAAEARRRRRSSIPAIIKSLASSRRSSVFPAAADTETASPPGIGSRQPSFVQEVLRKMSESQNSSRKTSTSSSSAHDTLPPITNQKTLVATCSVITERPSATRIPSLNTDSPRDSPSLRRESRQMDK